MPTIPKTPRTVSQLIPSQVPSFIREDYPMFVAFLKAYYEWLETFGALVWSGKIVGTTSSTVILPASASTELNAYADMFIACVNGPAKGQTQKISSYDPATRTVLLSDSWDTANVPPPNTKMEIRDSFNPEKLLEYKDVDYTLDRFIDYFRDEFLYKIPGNILADDRNVLKHIKQFYQAKGTENSFRFIFRILFNQEVEFYYPKVDLFRPSDAHWYTQKVMKTTTNGDTFDYLNRQVVGVVSGATASVESVVHQQYPQGVVSTYTLSNINGAFQTDPKTGLPEQVKIVYKVNPPPQTDLGASSDLLEPYDQLRYESTYQLLEALAVQTPGDNYVVGDTITINGGGCLAPAHAVVTSVFITYYTGRCQVPPSTYYLEPFYGPNDTVNPTKDFTKDGVCIPGMYFFSDVHSTYSDADLLKPNEILLASNTTNVDNFFVGDEISLTKGTGRNQKAIVVSYDGASKIATVDTPFAVLPDGTTEYSITHVRGGIKSVKITDFGLGFVTTPTVTINSALGAGAALPPALGIVGTTNGQWTPGRDGGIGGFPTTTDSTPSTNKIIQDSYYWQDFSYDIRFGETIDKYRGVVKSLLHPAGLQLFGSVLINTNLGRIGFMKILRDTILHIEDNLVSMRLVTDEEKILHHLHLSTVTPASIGAKNKDYDWEKFFAFPPNVRWNTVYPPPNSQYWSKWGPGNTQIQQIKDLTIASFVNFPERRIKFNVDADIKIKSTPWDVSRVGPVGQSRAALAQFRFVGFPPYETFDQPYPYPNEGYWGTGYGNTQISHVKNIVISEVIESPQNYHSNICVDADVSIYTPTAVPSIGDQVEYDFLEGMDPQIVYNISPNAHGAYDAVLGSNILAETIDGTWINQGVQLQAADSQIINATGVPMHLSECTVLVIASTTTISADQTVVSCIQSSSDNGFSIDSRQSGAISFRVQYNGQARTIDFPINTIKDNTYFMAALRFNNGRLSANVNNSGTLTTVFPVYPAVPVNNNPGWYFGYPSSDYTTAAHSASEFSEALFKTTLFNVGAVSSTSVSMGYFDGVVVYAVFFDRALYDWEVNGAYYDLRARILNDRGIILHDTTAKAQVGQSRIQNRTKKTQTGTAKLVRIQIGKSRIRTTSRVTQTGICDIYATTAKTQLGVTATLNRSFQTRSGISRVQITVPFGLTGKSAIQNTTGRLQLGVTNVTHRISQTQIATARMQNTSSASTTGISRVQLTFGQSMTGLSRLQVKTQHTQTGIAAVFQANNKQTQTGKSRIRVTRQYTQTGGAWINFETKQVQTGVSCIGRTKQTMTGKSDIYVHAQLQTMTGKSHFM